MMRTGQPKAKPSTRSRLNLTELLGRVSKKDVALFCRQMSVMVNAGVPIVHGIDVLWEQFKGRKIGAILRNVRNDVEGGMSFSEALSRRKGVFGDFFISMVAVGETGGVLGFTLNRVAEYLEKMIALRGKVRSAMAYPLIILFVTIAATIFMLVSIIPTFAKMFATFDAELPLPTQIVIKISDFVVHNGAALFLLTVLGFVVGYYIFRKTPQGRYIFDGLLLNIPILGQVLRKSSISRFSRTLGVLIQGGVPILEALEITARTSGNLIVEKAVLDRIDDSYDRS